MSTETADANRARMGEWLADHKRRYLSSGGVDGHVEDMTAQGAHAFTTNCMIRYTGRKSGRTYINPLIYNDIGGEVVLVASKGGSDAHPIWYLNLIEQPTIDFQVGTQAFRGTWRIAEGEERAALWPLLVKAFPTYERYQASTSREIPLILLKPVERIAVFRAEDEG